MKSYQILGPAFVGYVALVLGVLTYRIAIRPTREASRLGMRGLQRQRALLHVAGWADVEPFIRWLGVRLSGVLSDKQRSSLDQRLVFSGEFLGVTPDELFAMMVTGALIGLGAGAIVWVVKPDYGVIAAVSLAFLGGVAPLARVDQARQNRMTSINRGLPYAIDLIALATSAGSDFPGAVRQVLANSKKRDDALTDELAYLLQQLELGRTRTQALRDFMERTPSEPVAEFVQAVIQAEERGNPLSGVLIIQADMARIRRTNAAENKAQEMRSKMLFPVMGLGIMTFVYIAYATYDYVETLTHSMNSFGK